MITKLVLATQNPGKIKDIKQIFADFNFFPELIIPQDIEEPEENGDSFFANALIKAKFYAGKYNTTAIADDSGLEIKALNGFPGVRTREFADEQGGYSNSFNQLEQMLQSYPHPYHAKFISTIVFYDPVSEEIFPSQAELPGTLDFSQKDSPTNVNGFGYSPIFIAEGYNKVLAQLPIEEYYKISHRRKSIKGLLNILLTYNSNNLQQH